MNDFSTFDFPASDVFQMSFCHSKNTVAEAEALGGGEEKDKIEAKEKIDAKKKRKKALGGDKEKDETDAKKKRKKNKSDAGGKKKSPVSHVTA